MTEDRDFDSIKTGGLLNQVARLEAQRGPSIMTPADKLAHIHAIKSFTMKHALPLLGEDKPNPDSQIDHEAEAAKTAYKAMMADTSFHSRRREWEDFMDRSTRQAMLYGNFDPGRDDKTVHATWESLASYEQRYMPSREAEKLSLEDKYKIDAQLTGKSGLSGMKGMVIIEDEVGAAITADIESMIKSGPYIDPDQPVATSRAKSIDFGKQYAFPKGFIPVCSLCEIKGKHYEWDGCSKWVKYEELPEFDGPDEYPTANAALLTVAKF